MNAITCPMCDTLFTCGDLDLHEHVECPGCDSRIMRVASTPFGVYRTTIERLGEASSV